MKAKRNLFVSLVTLMLLLCCSMLFVACDDEGGTGGSNPTYTVAFKVDGRNYDIVLVEAGKTVMLPADPAKDGYTFDGWYADEACLQDYTASAVSQSIDVYAKFTANVYTITYEADGGTNPNTATTFTVKDKIVLADAQKAGYLFKGWKNGDEYMTSIPKGTTENITLTAVFEKDGYIITYENVDDAYCKNPKAYAVDDETFELNPAYKEGYTFDGWYTNEKFTGEQVTEIAQGSTGDLTLYAKFTLIEGNIVYLNTKDIQHGYATKYSVEQPVYVADLEKAGYTFLGWFDGYDNKVTVVDFDGFWGENVTLTAKWQLNTYTITYEDLRGADNSDNKTAFTVEDGTISFADLADRGGFTFAGWSFMNGTPEKFYTFDVSERDDDIILTAKWNAPDSALAKFTYVADDQNRITITGVKDTAVTELTVPDYVYSIDLGAFQDCTALQKLTVPYVGNRSNGEYGSIGYFFGAKSYKDNLAVMPESLTNITVTGGYNNNETMKTGAFYDCRYLTDVVIGDGVTAMGNGIFYDNFALTNLTVPFAGESKKTYPDSYMYPLHWLFYPSTSDSESMYYASKSLYYLYSPWSENFRNSLTAYIPNTLKQITVNGGSIPEGCFYAFKYVEKIVLGDGVDYIGTVAIHRCTSLKELVVPDSVTRIGYYIATSTFCPDYYATMEEKAKNGDGYWYIGKVLYRYYGTEEDLVIKDGTVSICSNFLDDNTNISSIKTVKCPDSLRYIGCEDGYDGTCLFYGCTNLTKVELNEGLEFIHDFAFYNCTALSDINFPDSIKYVGLKAFYGTAWYDKLSDGDVYIGKVYYKYKGEMTEDTAVTIKDGTYCISGGAFSNGANYSTSNEYDKLVAVNIPDSVEWIADGAFANCVGLKSITLPKNLTRLGQQAFYNCTSLEGTIVVPAGVEMLSYRVFCGTNISELRFAEGSKLKYLTRDSIPSDCTTYLPSSVERFMYSVCETGNGAMIMLPADADLVLELTYWYGNELAVSGTICYMGSIADYYKYGNCVAYYSEERPEENIKGNYVGVYTGSADSSCSYWHYDENGKPVLW